MSWRRELRGAKRVGNGEIVNGMNMEKKVWRTGYSALEILGCSEEGGVGIFDLLGTLRHKRLETRL